MGRKITMNRSQKPKDERGETEKGKIIYYEDEGFSAAAPPLPPVLEVSLLCLSEELLAVVEAGDSDILADEFSVLPAPLSFFVCGPGVPSRSFRVVSEDSCDSWLLVEGSCSSSDCSNSSSSL